MRLLGILVAAVLVLLLPSFALADTVFVSIGLTPVSGPSFLQPFNSSLGTLNSVEVTITGQITALVQTQVNLVADAGPVPTPFSVFANQNFSGNPSGSFFTFVQPATFAFNGFGSGEGELQQLTDPFNYAFQFNSSTDVTGMTSVSSSGPMLPPGLAFGTLNGFTNTFAPFSLEFMSLEPGSLPGFGGNLVTTSVQGDILVQYDYTPATPAATPEPATLLLLGTGLLGLAARRRAKP